MVRLGRGEWEASSLEWVRSLAAFLDRGRTVLGI
jgi:hypothetical protein